MSTKLRGHCTETSKKSSYTLPALVPPASRHSSVPRDCLSLWLLPWGRWGWGRGSGAPIKHPWRFGTLPQGLDSVSSQSADGTSIVQMPGQLRTKGRGAGSMPLTCYSSGIGRKHRNQGFFSRKEGEEWSVPPESQTFSVLSVSPGALMELAYCGGNS